MFNATCTIQAPGTYDPINGYCDPEPMTPTSVGVTRELETKHVCNKLQFNTLLTACAENTCELLGMCKKIPSMKIMFKVVALHRLFI